MKSWFKVQSKGTTVDVDIHSEIGLWGVSAQSLIDEVKSHQEVSQINISIHSYGGSAFDGLAIYNYLKSHGAQINTSVLGVAASAASVILMAGDNITMPEEAFIMIHQPWTAVIGDADEMRDTADFLDKINDSIISIYQQRTGLEEREVRDLVSEETWLNGSEALEKNFVDSVTEQKAAAMTRDMVKHFRNPPEASGNEIAFDDLKEFGSWLCKTAGISKGEKEQVIFAVKKLFQSNSDSEPTPDLQAALSGFIKTLKQSGENHDG